MLLSTLASSFSAVLVVAVLSSTALPALAGHEPSKGFWPACEAGHVPPSPFSDLDGSTHRLAVECLRWHEVANGVSESAYGPAIPVRRDQVAALLARTLTTVRVALPPAADRFRDVDGNAHEDSIERLAAADIVFGIGPCSEDTSAGDCSYEPAGLVTRAQMATLLVRAYALMTDHRPHASCREGRYADDDSDDLYSDDDGLAHETNIHLASFYGLAQGKVSPTYWDHCVLGERGLYAPHDAVRRDQAATFLARLLNLGMLHGPGSIGDPYPRGRSLLLKDGWSMELLGSDDDATVEVLAHNPHNKSPAEEHRYVIVRVRASYAGPGTSTFDGGGRLAARISFGGSEPDGSPREVYPSAGRPCGDIPDELQNPAVAEGGTVEGNVCFEVPNGSYGEQPVVVDLRWGHPGLPHFSRFPEQDRSERSPYVQGPPVQAEVGAA